MIIIYHKDNKVSEIWDNHHSKHISFNNSFISEQILGLARSYPNVLLIWCHESLKVQLHTDALMRIFHRKHILTS